MPVYEYQCKECGHIEEAFQKISESPLEICPQCKGLLKKLISQSSFHLKGSGWYVTDYGGSKSGAQSGNKSNGKSTDQSKKAASDS
jgi:putative FmdB family regulatory protein